MSLLEELKICGEVIRGLWAVCRGRWFVWRDASQDAVELVAEIEYEPNDPAEAHEMVRQAREELKLRARGKA